MTLQKLIEALMFLYNDRTKDRTVVIHLDEPQMGPIASTTIDHIYPGFDWEHDLIVISPTEAIVRKKK